ncbi:MAG TPA: response regulator [Candidatus Saccharimonadales bacterium]|nr:response regulator [Candidatus Saccharimonadales bacterium]
MTKILLVEDDKSLREIYGVRLFAEGYDVVSAGDGEEALALAIKERPMLIITDVMMPKISGFDMLDILRSTTETKDIKVIVMTALGSEDNKDRGERLGADRYLVKSQVGIEDVVHVVHELLGDQPAAPQPAPTPPPVTAAPQFQQTAPTAPQPMRPAPQMTVPPRATEPAQPLTGPRQGMVSSPAIAQPGVPSNQQVPMQPQPMQPQPPQPTPPSVTASEPPSRRTRIIQPINDPGKRVDIQALVDKELAKEGGDPVASTDEERQVVADQLNNFVGQQPPAAPSQLPPVNPPAAPAPQAPPVAPAAAPAPPTAAPQSQPPTPPPAA